MPHRRGAAQRAGRAGRERGCGAGTLVGAARSAGARRRGPGRRGSGRGQPGQRGRGVLYPGHAALHGQRLRADGQRVGQRLGGGWLVGSPAPPVRRGPGPAPPRLAGTDLPRRGPDGGRARCGLAGPGQRAGRRGQRRGERRRGSAARTAGPRRDARPGVRRVRRGGQRRHCGRLPAGRRTARRAAGARRHRRGRPGRAGRHRGVRAAGPAGHRPRARHGPPTGPGERTGPGE
jgi:hypothetical protein